MADCTNLKGGKGRGGQNPHWEVELDVVKHCSKGQAKKIVWLGRLAKLKIDILMRKFKNQEWFAYLLGEDMRVHDIFLPEQRATQTFVGNIECEEYNKMPIIGAMHSHHTMGSTSSGHDHDFVNSNHNISLIASHREGIQGQVRIKVPCGALFITKAEVRLDLEVDFDKKEFMKDVDDKINKKEKKECTAHTCYCGGVRCNQNRVIRIPNHARTFTDHDPGCTCHACQKDRMKYMNSGKKTWDSTADQTQLQLDTSVEFEGAWICEECSKINYEDEKEKLTECVWCQTPKDAIADVELTLMELDKEIEEFNSMIQDNQITEAMKKAMDDKYKEIVEELDDISILQDALEVAAKYLVLVKCVMGSEDFDNTLDILAGDISEDYAEEKDDILNELEDLIAVIDNQLPEKEAENLEK